MTLADTQARRAKNLGRKPVGMAAVLLPFTETGEIAEEAYVNCLRETVEAGLTPAVNMDTGYANLITEDEKARMLKVASEAMNGKPFVAGAFIEGLEGDPVDLYQKAIAPIAAAGGTPILFQTTKTHNLKPSEVADIYNRATADVETAYAFELGKMFAPNGEIWSTDTFEAILEIPQIKGAKHSSLDRVQEITRLEIKDRVRPDFMVFTGNDLGIDMIEYGSDYLLGLAAFSPKKFAQRDKLWAEQSPDYFAVADALQYLGNVAFRVPVPAYKHSAAVFLHMLGKIPTSKTHPRSASRPPWEAEILRDCANRLGLL